MNNIAPIAVLPIHLHNNHWVSLLLRMQNDGTIQLIYVDSLGHSFADNENTALIIQRLTEGLGGRNIEIIDASFVQQDNSDDCGAFTVHNLRTLVGLGDRLDGQTVEQIVDLLDNSHPARQANDLRAQDYNILHPTLEYDGVASSASLPVQENAAAFEENMWSGNNFLTELDDYVPEESVAVRMINSTSSERSSNEFDFFIGSDNYIIFDASK